jgi:hypothetical protein
LAKNKVLNQIAMFLQGIRSFVRFKIGKNKNSSASERYTRDAIGSVHRPIEQGSTWIDLYRELSNITCVDKKSPKKEVSKFTERGEVQGSLVYIKPTRLKDFQNQANTSLLPEQPRLATNETSLSNV